MKPCDFLHFAWSSSPVGRGPGPRRPLRPPSAIPLATLTLTLAAIALSQSPAPAPARIDFAREVYPIFTRSCQSCHGAKSQMAGLRLDAKTSALAKVVSPNDSAHSPLYQRVAGLGDQARMPMGGKLDPAEIATLKRWIDEGAGWPANVGVQLTEAKPHWAFIPPVRPAVPSVQDASWPKNPIDDFVLARLEKEGPKPSPEADRVTLLRRVSLDLIGLPPTPQEIDAFLADRSPDAYEKQLNRLFASPHYGERWGRIWLDAARYADSDGYEKDKQRSVWAYRDWVINALNRDLPYNEFIIDQIAGDLLPHATQNEVVATGFLRNSIINEEGDIDPEQFRMEAMFDRMDAIGKGILGVTIQCLPSPFTEHIEVHATLAQSAGMHYHLDLLKLTSMQEQRFAKQIRNAHKDLLEIQATRDAAEKETLRDAAKLYQYHHEQLAAKALQPTNGTPDTDPAPEYDPAKDGFVLQIPEIVRYIEYDNRYFRAARANIDREIVLSEECAPGCFKR